MVYDEYTIKTIRPMRVEYPATMRLKIQRVNEEWLFYDIFAVDTEAVIEINGITVFDAVVRRVIAATEDGAVDCNSDFGYIFSITTNGIAIPIDCDLLNNYYGDKLPDYGERTKLYGKKYEDVIELKPGMCMDLCIEKIKFEYCVDPPPKRITCISIVCEEDGCVVEKSMGECAGRDLCLSSLRTIVYDLPVWI